ncbi:MAG: hypothetical protein WAU65_01845 [Candidatus Nanoarchaeia archaeon]
MIHPYRCSSWGIHKKKMVRNKDNAFMLTQLNSYTPQLLNWMELLSATYYIIERRFKN